MISKTYKAAVLAFSFAFSAIFAAPAVSAATLEGTVTWQEPLANSFSIVVIDPVTNDFLGYCDSSSPECAITNGFSANYQLPISGGSGSYSASVSVGGCDQQSCLYFSTPFSAPFDAPTGHHDIALPAQQWGFVRVHALAPAGVTIASVELAYVAGTGSDVYYSALPNGPVAGDSVTLRVPAGDLSYINGIHVTSTSGDDMMISYTDLSGSSVQPGQTTTVDVNTFSSVTGTISWPNAFSAKSCKVFGGTCQLAPDGFSATYQMTLDPTYSSDVYVVANIGTCAGDPFSCPAQGGTRLSFGVGGASVVPGGITQIDGVLDPTFQFGQICGNVIAPEGTMTGGTVLFDTTRLKNWNFVGSSVGVTFGPDGHYCTQIASSDYGTAYINPTIAECSAGNPTAQQYVAAIPDGGNVTQDFTVSGYTTALPGSLTGLAMVPGFPQTNIYAYVEARRQWDNVFACAGGTTGGYYFGAPAPYSFTNLIPGNWDVFGNIWSSQYDPIYADWSFGSTRSVAVQPAAATTVDFTASQVVPVPVRVDLRRWQSEEGDTVRVAASAEASDIGSSTSFYPNSAVREAPIYLDLGRNWSTARIATSLESNYSDGGVSNLSAETVSPFSQQPPGLSELPGGSLMTARGLGYWTVILPPEIADGFLVGNEWNGTANSGGLQFAELARVGYDNRAFHAKLPPATHQGTADLQWFDWTNWSWNFLNKDFTLEIADNDEIVQDINGPQMSNRVPQPDTYCPQGAAGNGKKGINDSRGGTTIPVSAIVSLANPLSGVTINGKAVAVGSNGAVSTSALLKLGKQAIDIVATDTQGNKTSWKRYYTMPTELNGLASPMAALVPASTPVSQIPLPSKPIKLGSTLTLQLTVTSCGILQKNADMFASVPRIIAISRDGQQVPLHNIDPTATSDGIHFVGSQGGNWTLYLQTKQLGGVGTYVITIASPDGTRKVAAFRATK